jgi:hypothetical protein
MLNHQKLHLHYLKQHPFQLHHLLLELLRLNLQEQLNPTKYLYLL